MPRTLSIISFPRFFFCRLSKADTHFLRLVDLKRVIEVIAYCSPFPLDARLSSANKNPCHGSMLERSTQRPRVKRKPAV